MSTTIDYKPTLQWETPQAEMVSARTVSHLGTEVFTSVASPPRQSLGASIVDDFAEDMRRLADA